MDESPFDISPSFQQAVRELMRRRAPDWELAVDAPDGTYPVRVTLNHPVSAGYEWMATRAQVEADDVATLEALLNRFPEFKVPLPRSSNPSLLRGMRAVANAFGWPPEQVSALAGVLEDSGVITAEERCWLREVSEGELQ